MKRIAVSVFLNMVVVVFCAATVIAGEVVVLTSFPKELFEAYKQAFEDQHPGVTVVVKSKQTSGIVSYVQETAANPDVDLVWASATDAFAFLKAEGRLVSHRLPEALAARIPASVGPYPIHDLDGFYFGFALSGYGMMWNEPYMQAYRLPIPAEWVDLKNPAYYGHLSMSAPSRSGTTHLMVESIVQGLGWAEGWRVLMNFCGNMATITERSFGVPQGVNNGEFGVGLVIDFFAMSARASGYPVGFAYPSNTAMTPASIGIVKGGPNPENAAAFIHFMLGEEGQALLLKPEISRLPVIPELYEGMPEGFPNPFEMDLSGAQFDLAISEQRYGMVNSLFDQVITYRLPALKAAWGAIYKAEARIRKAEQGGRDVRRMRTQVDSARVLASQVPVDTLQAVDPVFAEQFRSAGEQARLETVWDAVMKANYAKAKQLADEALE
ncbi:MAG: extracellular solute-binding protein [bacterium]|nr:extracellular solute-binding protein [bacterium]